MNQRHYILRSSLVTILLACGSPARATSLIVPDQAPTIQAAIDAAADTVLIRPGAYPETLQVGRGLTLLGVSNGSSDRPTIGGLNIYDDYLGAPMSFQRVQFNGPLTVFSYPSSIDFRFDQCDLRGGITDTRTLGSIYSISLSKCFLVGPLSLPLARRVSLDSCLVWGSVFASSEDHVMTVRGCTFQGGGVQSTQYQSTCVVEGNIIRGGGFGVHADGQDVVVANNLIEDAQYEGLSAGDNGPVTVTNNVIRRCGSGLFARGEKVVVADNLIEDCQYGLNAEYGVVTVTNNVVRRCGWGIRGGGSAIAFVGNTVTQARAEGLLVERALRANIIGNVFWMCTADGVKIGYDVTREYVNVRNNTSCYNGLSGFASDSEQGVQEWVANIGYANQEYGINWLRAGVATITCNDWFSNRKGAVKGRPFSSDDFSVDPRFCDAPGGDVRLDAASPLLDWPGCGQVGALGVGCDLVAKSRSKARPRFGLAEVTPNPGRGPVRIGFALENAAAIEIDVFDVLGRRIASPARGVWPAGAHQVEWNGLGRDGQPAHHGVYMIRYAHPGGQDLRRIVHLP